MADTIRDDAVKTESVGVTYRPDCWPGRRARIGLIVLATDQTCEHDVAKVLAPDGVAFYVSRVAFANPTTADTLRTLAEDLTAAAALLLPDSRMDVVAFACTSGTVVIGEEEVERRIQAALPGVPVITPAAAAVAACKALRIRRLAVLTPYLDSINQPVRRFLGQRDIDILRMSSFDLESDVDMAGIAPDTIVAAAAEADHPDAEALFISCTALQAADTIDRLERRLGKPVISSNQVMGWHAQRLAGVEDRVTGYGRLLETC